MRTTQLSHRLSSYLALSCALIVCGLGSGCAIGTYIDASEAFTNKRAFTKQQNNSRIIALVKTDGERVDFINSAMFSREGERHFYGITTDSVKVRILAKNVERVYVRNAVDCKSTSSEYLPNIFFDFNDIDPSPQGLSVDGYVVKKVILSDGKEIDIARPGLFYNCEEKLWTGSSVAGKALSIADDQLAELYYRRPNHAVNMLIGAAIIGATATVSK